MPLKWGGLRLHSCAVVLAVAWSAAAAHGALLPRRKLAAAAELVAGAAAGRAPSRCATKHDPRAALDILPRLEERVYGWPLAGMSAAQLAQAVQDSAFPSTGITVPIHFHVITSAGQLGEGGQGFHVTKRVLAKQVAVLNADFKQAGIAFQTGSATWHTNRQWAQSCEVVYPAILQDVAKQPQRTLNVLLCDTQSFLGVATMPPTGAGFQEDDPQQGVVISFRSLPGGPAERYNLGRTLTHEVGHWCGLSHVFEGGCGGEGDGIGDTPAQAEPSAGCPISKDSCPGQPGRDNIHNFMDYSDDSCMHVLTLGQIARMQAVLLQCRPTLIAATTNPLPLRNGGVRRTPPPPRKRARQPPQAAA